MGRNQRNDGWGFLLLFGLGLVYLANKAPQDPPPLPPPRWVGLPPDWADFVAATQQSPRSCWAACVHMVLKSWGVFVAQDDIISRVKGAAIDSPASDEEISVCLDASAVNANRRWVNIRHRIGNGPVPIATLIAELNNRRPVLCVYDTGAELGHAVLITGVEFVPTPVGPCLLQLVYRDPDPSPTNLANNCRVAKVGEEIPLFLSSVRRHWLVTIS
jgi:hypothetical protein